MNHTLSSLSFSLCFLLFRSLQSLFSILGSISSFFAHLLYASSSSSSTSSSSRDGGPSGSFRLFCVGLVALSVPALEASCTYIESWATRTKQTRTPAADDDADADADDDVHASPREHDHECQNEHDERRRLLADGSASTSSSRITHTAANKVAADHIMQVRVSPAAGAGAAATSFSADSAAIPATSFATAPAAALTFRTFVLQLLRHRNFSLFCGLRLCQVFLCTFEKNHLSSFLDLLLGEHLSAATRAGLISSSFVLPHVMLLGASVFHARLGGVYFTIRALFATKIAAAATMIALVAFHAHQSSAAISGQHKHPHKQRHNTPPTLNSSATISHTRNLLRLHHPRRACCVCVCVCFPFSQAFPSPRPRPRCCPSASSCTCAAAASSPNVSAGSCRSSRPTS